MPTSTLELLWIGAFRYYCGRQTYAVSSFCEALIVAIPALPERARLVISRDLEETFARDDSARKHDRDYMPLGHDCDRAAWEKVREALKRPNA